MLNNEQFTKIKQFLFNNNKKTVKIEIINDNKDNDNINLDNNKNNINENLNNENKQINDSKQNYSIY